MDPRAGAVIASVQLWRGGSTLDLVDVPVPRPAVGEVLVEVRLATVCGSDLHTVLGRRPSPAPSVLGHEAVGTILELGDGPVRYGDGSPAEVGDRIVWGVTVPCGHCDRCLDGRTAKCRTLRKVGHEPFDGDWALSGCYASHVLLPAGATLVRVPDEVPDEVAAPAACATATVAAAVEQAGPMLGREVVVSGAGMLGLVAVAMAAEAGAAGIVVLDPDAGRRATAAAFGATVTGDPRRTTLGEVDVAFELSGAADAVEQLAAALTIGGRLVLAGSVSPGRPVAVDPEQVVRRWATVTGVHNYEPRHLAQAVDFLARTSQLRPWGSLVADPVPLDDLRALLAERVGGPVRTAVRP
ncbi:zinc-binding dehydrogenase [Kribbella italica]|uniref:alcohol dehydrogenase n=1 Tax=Kribbella italica TaxID=1540520 RepID=A0A7W9MTC4_9ACTN|nr:zinc-binding dehydrogenase [Kribbella italica]MBB5835651.1 putative phosphonate catabolism associated alcohol dehydrogenase [Kribbella italica]